MRSWRGGFLEGGGEGKREVEGKKKRERGGGYGSREDLGVGWIMVCV